MNVQAIQAYACPHCDTTFVEQTKAEKCFSACGKRKVKEEKNKARLKTWTERMNYIRLNATSIKEIQELLVSEAKKHFGAVFKFTTFEMNFGDVSNSHSAPIGKVTNWCQRSKAQPTSYIGFSGRVEGQWLKDGRGRENDVVDSFGDLFSDYDRTFQGFHTGTGGATSKSFYYHFEFFLDDFPKLKIQYAEYLKLKEDKRNVEVEEHEQNQLFSHYVEGKVKDDMIHTSIVNKIQSLQEQIDALKVECTALVGKHWEKAEKERKTKFPLNKSYDQAKYEVLHSMFCNRWDRG